MNSNDDPLPSWAGVPATPRANSIQTIDQNRSTDSVCSRQLPVGFAPLHRRTSGIDGLHDGDGAMTQTTITRPRVVAIGLDESAIESIRPLCGTLRTGNSLSGYLNRYNWTETDITILCDPHQHPQTEVRGHVLMIGSSPFNWLGHNSRAFQGARQLRTYANTERELGVPTECPDEYRHLAGELARQLGQSENPVPTYQFWGIAQDDRRLVATTSGAPVALRGEFTHNPSTPSEQVAVALALPEAFSLPAWSRAFLADIHEVDPAKVPHAPPRLANPSDWYTPQETQLELRLSQITDEINQLEIEREQVKTELASASEQADIGIRRCIWDDGEELVDAVAQILQDLGFVVRHMDPEKEQGEPKREDLRLTHADLDDWEAMAEVKGYPNGTKTSDSRQIREHRDRYREEEGQLPDLTLWISNTYRLMDASSRPAPDRNVDDAAAGIGATHVLTTDLYRLWMLVKSGDLEPPQAAQQLAGAAEGLWSPSGVNPEGMPTSAT